MEQSENPGDGQSSAKVVMGIRMMPTLKGELLEESSWAGMSASEYGEVILLNRHKPSPEMEKLSLKVAEQQQEIELLTQLSNNQAQEVEKLKTGGAVVDNKQLELLKKENEQLRLEIKGLNDQSAILNDQRLLFLFEHLKGKSDTVENAYGKDFNITYRSTREVLLALIYNTKLNQ